MIDIADRMRVSLLRLLGSYAGFCLPFETLHAQPEAFQLTALGERQGISLGKLPAARVKPSRQSDTLRPHRHEPLTLLRARILLGLHSNAAWHLAAGLTQLKCNAEHEYRGPHGYILCALLRQYRHIFFARVGVL
ncbi:hypothetical protein [Agrobacterium sp.]|uniref:hypothetical protein n=1 Tax=Agrobacterium sp. TaxID=361 RepID=UPI00289D7AA5|nr:hypothetical protein [Agrobacterium sp.]